MLSSPGGRACGACRSVNGYPPTRDTTLQTAWRSRVAFAIAWSRSNPEAWPSAIIGQENPRSSNPIVGGLDGRMAGRARPPSRSAIPPIMAGPARARPEWTYSAGEPMIAAHGNVEWPAATASSAVRMASDHAGTSAATASGSPTANATNPVAASVTHSSVESASLCGMKAWCGIGRSAKWDEMPLRLCEARSASKTRSTQTLPSPIQSTAAACGSSTIRGAALPDMSRGYAPPDGSVDGEDLHRPVAYADLTVAAAIHRPQGAWLANHRSITLVRLSLTSVVLPHPLDPPTPSD
jgi:hypothetical protein